MDHFSYQGGVYHAEGVSLAALAEHVGTPCYVYASATLTRHYEVFSACFPKALICYAVKANGNLALLATLARLGCGADVVSGGEIRLALAAGMPAEKIVFSGVGKTASEMAFALQCNIFQFNVESEAELDELNHIAMQQKMRARVAIRVNPDVDAMTHAKISTGHGDSKFGVPMEQAFALYCNAAKWPNLVLQGISVHIGSQLTSLAPFESAFAGVRNFVQALNEKNIRLKTVDLGGGLGIPYDQSAPPLPEAYAKMVHRNIAGLDAQLILEPGRMLVGNSGVLLSRVIRVKTGGEKTFVIVDAGMNDLLRPALYDAYHEIVPVRQPDRGAPCSCVELVGPVCETSDVLAKDRQMPALAAGDLIAIRSAGAYGASMASTYNARPLVAEVMVRGHEYAITRPRQSYEELLRCNILPKWL